MLILNIIGCVIIGFIAKEYIKTDTIVIKRLSSEIYNIFLMSICTGMIMTISVKYTKENNFTPYNRAAFTLESNGHFNMDFKCD